MNCQRPVLFFRSPYSGRWRPFEPKPVDTTQQLPAPAYPIENQTIWWPYRDLVEDLMVRHHCSQAEAEDEAHAMPWHLPHTCPNRSQEATP
jgi:hypothetical protein